MRLTNLRSVTTRVTVSDVHSVVRMNTPRTQTYLGWEVKDGRDGEWGLRALGKGKEQGDGGNSLLGSAWSEQDTANSNLRFPHWKLGLSWTMEAPNSSLPTEQKSQNPTMNQVEKTSETTQSNLKNKSFLSLYFWTYTNSSS